MALNLQKNNDFGSTNEYWRIMSYDSNVESNTTKVIVAGYVSQAARDAGKASMITNTFDLSGVDKTRADIYTELKTLDFFTGATDV